MNVLMVEPGMEPYEKEINGWKEMQAAVGGLFTFSYPYKESIAIVSNDESILEGMPFNRSIEGGYGGIFGPFFVCGLSGEDCCSLTPEQMEHFKKKFHQAEILVGARGNEPVTLKVEARPHTQSNQPKRPPKTPGR